MNQKIWHISINGEFNFYITTCRGVYMVVNTAEKIKSASYIKNCAFAQEANDAYALLNIINLAEDDIKAKRTREANIAFSEIKKRLLMQA